MRVLAFCITLYGLLSALESHAHVAFPDFLKQKDPDSIVFMAASEDECGASVEDVEKIIRVVLVGSRLKPVPWMADQSPSVLVLAVDLHCFGDGTLKNYDINVEFVRWSKEHRAPVAHLERYGFFGRGDEEDILNALEEGVERAVTEYIEVNFDPQPE